MNNAVVGMGFMGLRGGLSGVRSNNNIKYPEI
jgi:hypothetical protein